MFPCELHSDCLVFYVVIQINTKMLASKYNLDNSSYTMLHMALQLATINVLFHGMHTLL